MVKKYFPAKHQTEYPHSDQPNSNHHFCAKFFTNPKH